MICLIYLNSTSYLLPGLLQNPMGFLELRLSGKPPRNADTYQYNWLPREGELPLAKSGAIPKDFQRKVTVEGKNKRKEKREVTVGDGRDGRQRHFTIIRNISY